jgi:hypothetical protein
MTALTEVDTPAKPTPEEARAKWIADARALIDFVEAHPLIADSTVGIHLYLYDWHRANPEMDAKEFVATVARAIAPYERKDGPDNVTVTRSFGSHGITLSARLALANKRTVPGLVEEFDVEGLLGEAQ